LSTEKDAQPSLKEDGRERMMGGKKYEGSGKQKSIRVVWKNACCVYHGIFVETISNIMTLLLLANAHSS